MSLENLKERKGDKSLVMNFWAVMSLVLVNRYKTFG
jgi:hypothetical protein